MAPGRRTSKGVQNTALRSKEGAKSCEQNEEKPRTLTKDDVTCKICLNILIKPVTLPCKHALCFSCFENCVQKSNLTCPLCRKRISVWCRQATKTNSVIDDKLWGEIQLKFPDLVKDFLDGNLNDQDTEELLPIVPTHQFAQPGELRKEYEAEQERIRKDEEERKKREEAASAELIAQLEKEQAEEEARAAERERQRIEDEALALQLASQENATLKSSSVVETPQSSRKRTRKSSSGSLSSTPAAKKVNHFFTSRLNSIDSEEHSASPSAFVAVTEHLPKGITVNCDQRGSSSDLSVDCIDVVNGLHFRPINAAPLTPPKNSPGSSTIVKPQFLSGTAKNLIQFYDDGDLNHNQSAKKSMNSGFADEFRELEERWLQQRQDQEEADRKLALKLQEELNKETSPATPLINRKKGSQDEYQLRTKRTSRQSKIEDVLYKPLRKSAP